MTPEEQEAQDAAKEKAAECKSVAAMRKASGYKDVVLDESCRPLIQLIQ